MSARKPITGLRCFFQIASSIFPVKTLYSPLAIKSRTFAIVSAKTAANERVSKVFSCPVFCNEDKLKRLREMPTYQLNLFLINSFIFFSRVSVYFRLFRFCRIGLSE